MLDLLKAVILGIVEGVTEFLPISSTGHLIVAGQLLRFPPELAPTFEIFIQLGAVLAVAWLYHHDLWMQLRAVPTDRTVQRLWFNLFIAFLPAAAIGFLFHTWIKTVLFSPLVVSASMIAGGIVLVLVEWRPRTAKTHELSGVRWRQAAGIGLAQMLALIPGASRSATSIIGGLLTGLDRETATIFSFYLALPTLGLATLFDLLTSLDHVSSGDRLLMAVGLVVAFVTSLLVMRWLLRYIARHDFRVFGYYRIAAGTVILLWVWLTR